MKYSWGTHVYIVCVNNGYSPRWKSAFKAEKSSENSAPRIN